MKFSNLRYSFTKIRPVFRPWLGFMSKLITNSLAIFVISLVFSCSDNGCIDADDFGEYESKNIEVKAHDTLDSCEYNTTYREDLRNEAHGSGVSNCLTSQDVTVYFDNGTFTSDQGCAQWQPLLEDGTENPDVNMSVMNLCVNECMSDCNSKAMRGFSGNPEPMWKSTLEGTAVEISPGKEVSVRAVGRISLGGKQDYGKIFVYPDSSSFLPTAKDKSRHDHYLSVGNGEVMGVSVSGGFVENTVRVGLMEKAISGEGVTKSVMNASERVVLYKEKTPVGYRYEDVDKDGKYQDSDVRGTVTAYPDHRSWKCEYREEGDAFESNCANDIDSYMDKYGLFDGATSIADEETKSRVETAINSKFPIRSTGRALSQVGNFGGILKGTADIRDSYVAFNANPFRECASGYDCAEGRTSLIAGDISSGSSVVKSRFGVSGGYQLYFKYLQDVCSTSGNGNIDIKISDAADDDDTLHSAWYHHDNLNITDVWTNGGKHVSVENGQHIHISKPNLTPNTFSDGSGNTIDCGRSLAIKLVPYYDLPISRSGLVSFSNLSEGTDVGAEECILRFRIINPTGWHKSYDAAATELVGSGLTALQLQPDFYEYGGFSESLGDTEDDNVIKTVYNDDWPDKTLIQKIYIRKGQKIRFAPESWTGDWEAKTGVNRKCGVGMAIRIEPRPALLCPHTGVGYIPNPECTPNIVNGAIRGCQALSPLCSSEPPTSSGGIDSAGESYCPDYVNCVGDITFTEPSNRYDNRSEGVVSPRVNPADKESDQCGYIYDSTTTPPINADNPIDEDVDYETVRTVLNQSRIDKCTQCQEEMMNAAVTNAPFLTKDGIQLCYDLESYQGSVRNITHEFSRIFEKGGDSASGVPAHDSFTKGLIRLREYNDSAGADFGYGSLGSFGTDIEGSFVPYGDKYFGSSGRLKAMVLDGADFEPRTLSDSYSDNNTAGGNYNSVGHNNGFRIRLSNFLEFRNGENMEVLFCVEPKYSSRRCRALSRWDHQQVKDEIVSFLAELAAAEGESFDSDAVTPTDFTNVPDLVDFSLSASSFAFDEFGNLYRKSSPAIGKANCDGVLNGDKYFCHCRGDFESSDVEKCAMTPNDKDGPQARYSLTFKITDPENTNCLVPTIDDPDTAAIDEGISAPCGAADQPACNGIKVFNTKYLADSLADSSSEIEENPGVGRGHDNDGKICSYSDISDVDVECKKQFICNSKYSNNSGKYDVVVRVKSDKTKVSGLVNAVINPVIRIMDGYDICRGQAPGRGLVSSVYSIATAPGEAAEDLSDDMDLSECPTDRLDRVPGQVERIYQLIIQDEDYILTLKLCLTLMISFYGLTFLMGLHEGGTADIIARIVKIAVVFFFVSDNGWYWFNEIVVTTFKRGTDEIAFLMATSFDSSTELRTAIESQNYADKSVLFTGVDRVLGLFFASAVQKKISALLFSGLFGWLYILIIYYAFIAYIFAVSTAVLVYLTAQVFISILFVLGPIFFLFTLFNQTKEMFDKWLQQLIGFSLQQIFLLVTLSFFNMMMYEIIKNALGYKVCWDEVWTINIIIRISLMSFWTIPNVPPLFDSHADYGTAGRGEGVPSFFSILFIWIMAKLMQEFITFMSNVAADIGGSMSATGMAQTAMQSVSKLSGDSSKWLKNTRAYKKVSDGVSRVDQKLFDSGRFAKQDRREKKLQDENDLKNKNAMVKSGRSAVNEYKKNHGAELSKMSKEEQQKTLNNERDKAMNAMGKKLGLDEKDRERLMNDKGVKYRGDHLVGYMAKAARQKYNKGGSVSKSITEDDVSRDLTKRQARKALNRAATSEDRGAMMKAVREGNIHVEAGSVIRGHRKLDIRAGLPQVRQSDGYKEARRQLEREGKIDNYNESSFAGMLRSDEDKKMIRDRVKKNALKKDDSMNKRSRISTIASLEGEREYLDAKEDPNAEGRETYMRRSALNKATFGRYGGEARKFATPGGGQKARRADIKNQLKENRLGSISQELKAKAKESQQKAGKAKDLQKTLDSTIDRMEMEPGVQELVEIRGEIDNLREQKEPDGSWQKFKGSVPFTSERSRQKGIQKDIDSQVKRQVEVFAAGGPELKAKMELLDDKRAERWEAQGDVQLHNEAAKETTALSNSVDQVRMIEINAKECVKTGEGGPHRVKHAHGALAAINQVKKRAIDNKGGRKVGTTAAKALLTATGVGAAGLAVMKKSAKGSEAVSSSLIGGVADSDRTAKESMKHITKEYEEFAGNEQNIRDMKEMDGHVNYNADPNQFAKKEADDQ